MRNLTNTLSWFLALRQGLAGAARLALVAATFLAASQPAARADVVLAQYNTVAPARDFAFTFNGQSFGVTTGMFQWTTVGGDVDLGKFQGFCLEVMQGINTSGPTPYTVVPLAQANLPGEGQDGPGTFGPMGSARADLLSELWGRHFAKVNDGVTAAAFQIAVWEVVNDADLNLGQGGFKATDLTDPSVQLAQVWLNSLNGTGPRANLIGLTHPDHQDQVTVAPSSVVPEPATFLLSGIGAGGLLLVAWRRRKRAA